MPFTVTMPKMSPTMEEGSIAKWCKKEGEQVKSGEVLIEVATDKATVEYEALDDGYLRKILVPEGGQARVNQAIAIFTVDPNESIEDYTPEGEQPAAEPSKQETPKAGEKPADTEAPVPAAPAAVSAEPAFVPEPALEGYEFTKERSDLQKRILASPLARKLAKKKGVDISTVKGSGPGGRVMSRDLDLAQPDRVVAFGKRDVPKATAGSFEEIPMSPMRKIVAQRLSESKTYIPHFYVTQMVNASALVEARDHLKKFDISLTYNDFVVRACALALREVPEVNSGYNSVNKSIIRFKTIDIAIAVTVDGGLITPIVRYADYKELGEISVEVKYLAQKAKNNQLQPEEYKGGSFTISNLGMYGVTSFSAIVNPPQAAILAVGGISDQPVVKNGRVSAGKVMEITLSCDHRVIDGALAAKFVKTVQQYLENPSVLIV